MIALGIDPDLHATSFGLVNEDSGIVAVGVAKVPSKFKGAAAVVEMAKQIEALVLRYRTMLSCAGAVAIEGQQIYLGRSQAVPDAILRVAQVAGAALGVVSSLAWMSELDRQILLPRPVEWKGNVPKDIHQARVLRHYGIDFMKVGKGKSAYCRPTADLDLILKMSKLRRSDWKHINDAIGLAKWAIEKGAKRGGG